MVQGFSLPSPNRSVKLDLYQVGFVDNTCSYVNIFLADRPPSPAQMIQLLSHDSHLWCDLLWKSGGALELPKCTYYFSQYQFATNGSPFLQSGRIGPQVLRTHGDGITVQVVPSTSAYKAYKTLGCYKSPSGA
jgi:hypothetical protein